MLGAFEDFEYSEVEVKDCLHSRSCLLNTQMLSEATIRRVGVRVYFSPEVLSILNRVPVASVISSAC